MLRALVSCAACWWIACNPGARLEPDGAAAPSDAAELDAAARPDPVALLAEMPGACSVDRWCWRRPVPRGVRLAAVFATAPDNLWMAGEAGYVLQWDGERWREHALPAPPFRASMNLSAIAGRARDDMWVAGGDVVYHWDGAAWTLRDFIPPDVDQEFHGLWVAPNRDVWVTMEYGRVRRALVGGEFEELIVPQAQAPLSALGAVWGASPSDVWISGRPGRMFHWDGSEFTEHATGTHKSGGALAGAGPDDAWVGGYDGTLVHWNGATWQPVDTGLGDGWYIQGISVVAADDVWWIAQHGSQQAAVLHWDGSALTTTPIATGVLLGDLEIVDGRWWVPADGGAVYVSNGAPGINSSLAAAIDPAREAFRAIWGTSSRNLYFGGPGLLVRHDGEHWTYPPISVELVSSLDGVRVGSHDELWAAGSSLAPDQVHRRGEVVHFDGAAWTRAQLDPSRPLNGVWASAPGEAIAVGDGGAVYRYASGAWRPIAAPVDADLFGVWGPDPDHAWIVGARGTLLRWERARPDVLVPEDSGVDADLRAIHGAGGAVWIATSGLGPDGMVAVLERSGATWIRHPVPHLLDATAVHANAADDVRFVGLNNAGRVFRWNGSTFVEEQTGSTGAFWAVFQPEGSPAWIGGDRALLRREP